MGQIVKVIFDDGKEIKIDEVIPMEEILPTDEFKEKNRKRNLYLRQFKDLETEVLEKMSDSTVEQYARNRFDLDDANDEECYDKHLDTCNDDELMDEARNRGLIGKFQENIISADFLKRFSQIAAHENHIALDEWLSQMENRLRIVS